MPSCMLMCTCMYVYMCVYVYGYRRGANIQIFPHNNNVLIFTELNTPSHIATDNIKFNIL